MLNYKIDIFYFLLDCFEYVYLEFKSYFDLKMGILYLGHPV